MLNVLGVFPAVVTPFHRIWRIIVVLSSKPSLKKQQPKENKNENESKNENKTGEATYVGALRPPSQVLGEQFRLLRFSTSPKLVATPSTRIKEYWAPNP